MNQKPINNSAIFALFNERERDLIVSAINCKCKKNTDACEMISNADAFNALMEENKVLCELAELFLFEYVWTVLDPDGYCLGTFDSLKEAKQYLADYELTAEQGYTLDYSNKDYLTFK